MGIMRALKGKREEASTEIHGGMAEFYSREFVKYETKAAEAEADGKTGAAKRYRKVAERNRRLAEKHDSAL